MVFINAFPKRNLSVIVQGDFFSDDFCDFFKGEVFIIIKELYVSLTLLHSEWSFGYSECSKVDLIMEIRMHENSSVRNLGQTEQISATGI